jgi:PAS domain S-box-containing protein
MGTKPTLGWPQQTARLTATLALFVALAVLLGWIVDAPELKSVVHGWPKMSALTATAFALTGLALLTATASSPAVLTGSFQDVRHRVWIRFLSQAGAALVAMIASLRLTDYALGWNFGIDALGFDESLPSAGAAPARMAPATALNFLLIACALLAAQRARWALTSQLLAVAVGALAWIGLSHYIYGGEPLVLFGAMAIHTAATFLLLGAGVFCLRTDAGPMALLMSETEGGVLARRLVPAVFVAPLLLGWLRLLAQKAGWFGTEAGVTVFALSNMVVFGALIWMFASRLARSETVRRNAEIARARSEQEYREEQRLLQALVDSSPAVIYVKDLSGRYVLVNRRYEECFHLSREAIVGKTDHDIFPHEFADRFRTLDRRVALVGEPLTEEEVAPVDGVTRSYISVKCPLKRESGELYAVFGISTDITDRKTAEEAARSGEERTRLIVENALDAVITIDREGTVVGWNPQAEVTFGWTSSEVIGHPLADTIVPVRYRDAHRRGLKHFLATGEGPVLNRRVELAALHRDGHEFPIELAITPLRAGDVVSFSAFVRDITERKRADLVLREGEERFRTLAESLPHLVWTCRPDGYCDYLSRQWIEYTGRPVEEQLGYGWAEHLHPDDRERVQREWSQATERGDFFDIEFRIRRGADGSYRWFKTRAVPIRDANSQIIKWFGSNTDIDDSKRMEGRLQTQLGRLDLLNRITHAIGERQDLRSIFQVVVRRLEDDFPIDFGCVCLYEPANETLTVANVGIRSEALAVDLAMGENARFGADQNGLARCVRGQLVYEPDVRAVAFPFPQRLARGGLNSVVAAPLLVEAKVFGVLVAARREPHAFSSSDTEFLRQLSEHVGLAAHQAQVHAALQRAYEDLHQSQQSVLQQERLRALGQMASGIAHDINNAISPISLYTESLLENEPNLSTHARENLEIIGRAIDDVAATVARMREFYRQREPQAGIAKVDLNQLVKQVAGFTRARWSDMPQQRGMVVAMRTELATELPAIMGMESEIRDSLTNLIFNAVDAMAEGGTLTIRTSFTGDSSKDGAGSSRRSVQIEVVDTGVGMDEDTRRRCVEPFFTTKGERGTGLGLAMVFGMVRRHRAEIEIESAPGKGTLVRLIFAVADATDSSSDKGLDRQTTATRRSLRILVVDDDPIILKSLHETLEAEGHLCAAANGGQLGIDTFLNARNRSEPFDMVITDLGMPYVDGRKVAQAIKEISPATPVVLLTGWGQRMVNEGDIPARVDRVLGKPPKLRELRDVLAACCRPADR